MLHKLPFIGKASKETSASAATPRVKASPSPRVPLPPQIDYAKVRPNELGKIPVVMYHDIGTKPAKIDRGLVRSVAAFDKDLELLYAAGFRPVSLSDLVTGRIDVPAGKSPVVLTFDDARESQFRLMETDKALKVDPNCGVGRLQAFHKKHPDWSLKATFFCLPKSPRTSDSFGQNGLGDQKLQYLVDNGFEIGNHTINHKSMAHMPPARIQAEVGGANNLLLASSPKAKITVMALPFGDYPRKKADWKYLVNGSSGGKTYSYAAAMAAAYRPIPSPLSKEFNALHLERISPMDKDPNGLRSWIIKLAAAGGGRFVSDGDVHAISFPKSEMPQANLARIKAVGLIANPYAPFGGASGAKPIVAEGEATENNTPDLRAAGARSTSVAVGASIPAPKPISAP